jgi:hypothetical protein
MATKKYCWKSYVLCILVQLSRGLGVIRHQQTDNYAPLKVHLPNIPESMLASDTRVENRLGLGDLLVGLSLAVVAGLVELVAQRVLGRGGTARCLSVQMFPDQAFGDT